MAHFGPWLILYLMIYKKGAVIIFILIISLMWGSLVYKTHATDWFAAMKFSLDTAAKAAAQGAFRSLTNRILQKIQKGGLDGGSLFIQDWREFQLKSQYRGENVFRGVLASTNLCDYFDKNLKNIFGANNSIDLKQILTRTNSFDSFQVKAGCTLPSNFNLTNYQKDFSGNGGWEAWNRLLEPQNNFYGALFQSLDEAAKQRSIEESAATKEAGAGNGFVGIRDCLVQGTSACTILGKIKTPGSTLGSQVASIFDSNLKFYTTADAASLALAALADFTVGKLFDLAGSNTNDNGTKLSNENSYKNEFCTAKDNISSEAVNFVRQKFPKAMVSFPPKGGGGSFCEGVRDDNNPFPFERCVNTCYKDVGLLPDNVDAPPYTDNYRPNGPDAGNGVQPPADADTKHGNHAGEVATAKDELISEGMRFSQSSSECPDRFAITKRAVQKIGGGAGFLDKPGGNNCEGKAVDIIAFPDGYIYDTLNGTAPDGNGPMWGATGCQTSGGGISGTCPDRYRAP